MVEYDYIVVGAGSAGRDLPARLLASPAAQVLLLEVSTVPDQNPLYDALFSAAKAAGYKVNPDYNSEDQEGVVKTQTSIYKGRRMSVAHCYIEPAMKRSNNLHVVTHAHTLRVLLEGKRCVGVEYEKDGKPVQAKARETILSAGGVASPQILELSGI